VDKLTQKEQTIVASTTPIGVAESRHEEIGLSVAPEPTIASTLAISRYAYLSLINYSLPVSTGQSIIANHFVLDQFDKIPKANLDMAASKTVLFMHQSTGDYINNFGLGCLAGLHDDLSNYPQECSTYANNRITSVWPCYNNSKWNWLLFSPNPSDAMVKTDMFVDVVHSRAENFQVIGMKYCYVDGWNQGINVEQNYYINQMLLLESQYPNKTFIWSTSALWHDPGTACNSTWNSCEAISKFNQQVRTYALDHNKPLYDIADIESHDLNGTSCSVQGYEGMCADWYSNSGGHPTIPGSIRLAKGFWWLMARISGWAGQ
jgi:hypothetical protein